MITEVGVAKAFHISVFFVYDDVLNVVVLEAASSFWTGVSL